MLNVIINRKNRQLKRITLLSKQSGHQDGRISGSIGSHAGDRGFIGHKAAKMMKRAKSIENRMNEAIEEKKSLLKNIVQTDPLKMNILPFHSNRLIELKDVNLYYGDNEIAAGIDLLVKANDRVAVRGKNGSGKSTLIKLLLGNDIKYTGRVFIAKGLKISYVSQDTSYLEGSLTDFSVKYGLDETIFKTVLRQMDFERDQFDKDNRDFSQGQKKKELLAKSLSEHLFWGRAFEFYRCLFKSTDRRADSVLLSDCGICRA